MIKQAIYAGYFKHIKPGDIDIIRQAAELFDDLHIVIISDLNNTYEAEETLKQVKEIYKITNCTVSTYCGLLADYAESNRVKTLIRRYTCNASPEHEDKIRRINKALYPELEIIYIYPRTPEWQTEIDSRILKGIKMSIHDRLNKGVELTEEELFEPMNFFKD